VSIVYLFKYRLFTHIEINVIRRGRGFSQRRNGDSSPYRKDEDGDVSMDGEQTSHRLYDF